jgi:hypothetical protein
LSPWCGLEGGNYHSAAACRVRAREFGLAIAQVFQQRFETDHPGDRNPLIGLAKHFVMHHPSPHLHDVQIAMFDPPKLPRLYLMTPILHYSLHIINTDTGPKLLLHENGLQFCNVVIGIQ